MRIPLVGLVCALLSPPAWATEPSLPPEIDLVQKRAQLFEAYPPFPEQNAMTALRRYGNAISRYEQQVIGGWQQEILQRCRQVKDFERHISKPAVRADLSPNELALHEEAIADERLLCDAKHKDTSPLWQLEAELRAMNTSRFNELVLVTTECSSSEECRTK